MDLPTPGSPASRTTEPGTIPPPSTRSSSATPVGRATDDVLEISVMRRAGDVGIIDPAPTFAALEPARPVTGTASVTSSMEPHVSHSGQRPTHFATTCEQWEQR